jgi:hypothetical protein
MLWRAMATSSSLGDRLFGVVGDLVLLRCSLLGLGKVAVVVLVVLQEEETYI